MTMTSMVITMAHRVGLTYRPVRGHVTPSRSCRSSCRCVRPDALGHPRGPRKNRIVPVWLPMGHHPIRMSTVLTAAEDAHVGAVNGADVGAAPTWTAAGTAQS